MKCQVLVTLNPLNPIWIEFDCKAALAVKAEMVDEGGEGLQGEGGEGDQDEVDTLQRVVCYIHSSFNLLHICNYIDQYLYNIHYMYMNHYGNCLIDIVIHAYYLEHTYIYNVIII